MDDKPFALTAWMPSRREAIRSFAATALLIGAPACGLEAQTRQTFTPEMFGARGDGRTDDYSALTRLAAAVSRAWAGWISPSAIGRLRLRACRRSASRSR